MFFFFELFCETKKTKQSRWVYDCMTGCPIIYSYANVYTVLQLIEFIKTIKTVVQNNSQWYNDKKGDLCPTLITPNTKVESIFFFWLNFGFFL